MADPPPQSTKARNPNWGGRREGSRRKKHTSMLAALTLSRTHPTTTILNGTDGEQEATNQENGPLIINNTVY